MTKLFFGLLAFGLFAVVCLVGTADGGNASPRLPKIHPDVFEMVGCGLSDSEEPVVTEINLDAVAKNSNAFDFSVVKNNGQWIECPTEDGKGFKRFRQLKAHDGNFVVVYQYNGGGSLTTGSIIEFTIEKRECRKEGKAVTFRVLRVASIASN